MFHTFVWFFCCYSAARFSRISLSINGKKEREKSEKWSIIVKLTDGATALDQLLVLHSDSTQKTVEGPLPYCHHLLVQVFYSSRNHLRCKHG